ncbi:MAG: heme o synthase [Hyphomicrobiaceae bacterium]
MSETSLNQIHHVTGERLALGGTVSDYILLLKPRVMALVVFTALVGMVSAPADIHPVLAAIALLAIAVGAGASGALNMWYDADIDAQMARTAARPIPRGSITAQEALVFGSVLAVLSVLTLGILVSWVAGTLLALTIAFYMFVYTMWLKRRTPHNIVIGGAAGAFPPMVGWAAVTGGISIESIVLFLLIFVWTPPHFWALSLYRCRDYARVGVPMLPVVAGTDETRRQILIYSVGLAAVAIAPWAIGLGGLIYLIAAVSLSTLFLYQSWRVFTVRRGRLADREAKRLFVFSILYLFSLFAALLVEHSLARLNY